jgi:hypothetical protein
VARQADNPLTPAVVETRDVRIWSAINAGADTLTVLGIDGVTLAARDLDVRLNLPDADGSKIDWTQLDDGDDDGVFAGSAITDATPDTDTGEPVGITDLVVFSI